MNEKVFINSICGRCVHVDVCSSIKDNRQKCGSYLEQRQHGTWTEEFDESANPFFQKRWRCSACNDYNYYGRPDFCPCCGADMRKDVVYKNGEKVRYDKRPHGECKTCKHFVKGGLDGETYVCEHPDIVLDDHFDYACIMMNENDFCSRYEKKEGEAE